MRTPGALLGIRGKGLHRGLFNEFKRARAMPAVRQTRRPNKGRGEDSLQSQFSLIIHRRANWIRAVVDGGIQESLFSKRAECDSFRHVEHSMVYLVIVFLRRTNTVGSASFLQKGAKFWRTGLVAMVFDPLTAVLVDVDRCRGTLTIR
ncbi:hypothetical protein K0M31_014061 [Melipona bicolor]|uniref:Uncharacterized protein n=1 Tax=Melipona bicolor TaxID=60889 RepID=A0AA40KTX6_9HYME|nr:hypothetical protein K0M31_014061 [Melipona bicolor]